MMAPHLTPSFPPSVMTTDSNLLEFQALDSPNKSKADTLTGIVFSDKLSGLAATDRMYFFGVSVKTRGQSFILMKYHPIQRNKERPLYINVPP